MVLGSWLLAAVFPLEKKKTTLGFCFTCTCLGGIVTVQQFTSTCCQTDPLPNPTQKLANPTQNWQVPQLLMTGQPTSPVPVPLSEILG